MMQSISHVVGEDRVRFVDASSIATRLMGDSIATNLFMVGFAAQTGLLPLSVEAIERAIRLNGVAIEASLRTFRWGRVAAVYPETVEAVAEAASPAKADVLSQSLEQVIARREALLTDYQDAGWAARYRGVVDEVAAAEARVSTGTALTDSVARNLARLMSYKDEYEVARLHASSAAAARLNAQMEGNFKLKFHLAPPLLARRDRATGVPRKIQFGGWMLGVFRVLQRGKALRGTRWDVFGYTAERRAERALIDAYIATLRGLLPALRGETLAVAIQIAELPDDIRGFGHVKQANMARVAARRAELLAAFAAPPPPVLVAAA
jgi:indolepyruvate ferredoxin oxidoreductase